MNNRGLMALALCAAASLTDCNCNRDDLCVGDSDCADGEVCRNDACVARGSACLVDDECPIEQACQGGYCYPGERQARIDAGLLPDAGLECPFGEVRCLNSTTLLTCEFGKYARVDCSRNGLACVGDACRPEPCEPDGGASRCVDLTTVESCASPGTLTDCESDEICWKGACGTATGEPCTTDEECAGGYCHCKPGECDGPLANGYCSLVDCLTNGGNPCPATDVCMGIASAGGGRNNLCGRKADATCPESTSGQDPGYAGPFSRFMPVPDADNPERYSFGDAVCFVAEPRPVGAACAGPGECIGGSAVGFMSQCITFGGAVSDGYCTNACDQTHPCAPGNACAHRSEDPAGAGVCMLMCSHQRAGLATCERTGLSCQADGTGFNVLDGRTDALGFCAN